MGPKSEVTLMDDEELEVARTLADPGHPIYKVMLGLVALLTVLWTQEVQI